MNRRFHHFDYTCLILLVIAFLCITTGCDSRHKKAFDNVPDEIVGLSETSASLNRGTQNIETQSGDTNEKPMSGMIVPESYGASTFVGNDGLKRIAVRTIGSLRQVLNDSNATQLEAAERLGIQPIGDIRGAYHTKRPVVKIESGEEYEVDELKHSLPFLVPEAARLLSDIGRSFNDSLKSRGGEGYRIKVTSLLRTPQTVKKLRKVNINATEVSTHQYATTFDISYTKFHKYGVGPDIHDGDLKNLLAEILYNLREKGRCYVKFERHTSCFHITCR